ncbi:MAG: metallophosphoesterase, partial [Flavobacteriaceae bacterium]|nr:metallophosphoesterase [Flavobacteriaceae bacterium]
MRWTLFFLIYFVIDIYAFQALKTFTKRKWLYWSYWIVSFLVLGNFTWQLLFNGDSNRVLTPLKSYAFGFLLVVMLPKIIMIIILLLEDFIRGPQTLYSMAVKRKDRKSFVPSRRKFVSTMAMGLAAVPFTSLLYGMYKGRYNFKVLKYTLEFDDLPEAFDGYRITQVSDIHSGSFDDFDKVNYGIDLVNQQDSDLIVFTGDLVNNRADEMLPWQDTFAKLTARDGVYSVLGNHDYGDYVAWDNEEQKAANLEKLKAIQKDMGFNLLLNEHVKIEKAGTHIALVGVENWGAGHFKKAGDIQKASQGIAKNDFKVLLSHDPSYWDEKIKSDAHHYHLTLSGHTHG